MKVAIYSRKSKFTGKGDSIGNQIDRCKDYINFILMEEKNIEIEIFEDEGFIWGGRWAVWDNMHFEYHPEIIGVEKYKKYFE